MRGPISSAAWSSTPTMTLASRAAGTWRLLTDPTDRRPTMSSLGSYLRRERELRQISVAELAQTTRIPVRILHQLETDEIASLPADVFVRGFLRAYARALQIDEEHVLARYGGRQTPEPPPALPAAAYAPESGRRFGIAIAL